MTLLLRNMTVYTRFNRFQHRAINKDEKHKPMSRTGREAQAQINIMIPLRRPYHIYAI